MPNTVDLGYVFAHAGWDDNLTIYMTIIFTGVVFLVLLIWARRQDKKDLQMVARASISQRHAWRSNGDFSDF